MIAQLQVRRGTTAEWAAASPVVLAAGEPGYDTTLKMLKFGDGSTEWASLESETLKKYPVGAIYQSTVSTSPATLFGGTWSALEGRFLIGADETYEAGDTGGAATQAYTLSDSAWAQIRLNTANIANRSISIGAGNAYDAIYSNISQTGTGPIQEATPLRGSTDSCNNLPPYLAVYMWKRTA